MPQLVANAQGTISLSPSQAKDGATITVSGAGFVANTRGQMLFDGQTDRYATASGRSQRHPDRQLQGSHDGADRDAPITAMTQPKKARAAAAVMATANLLVVAASMPPPPTLTPARPRAHPDAKADGRAVDTDTDTHADT